MKLCIPIASPDGLAAALHADFGAAQHLLVIDSESGTHIAVDRARPETIAEETIAGIQGIVCSEIHPRLLFELQHNGIQVYGCAAETAGAALALFQAGELEAAPPFEPHEARGDHQHGHGCCGGANHAEEHECCGGKGHDDPDHECCGGKRHDDPDHECCGGKGHGHEHGHAHEHGHGHGGCGGHGRAAGGCGCGS